MPCCPSLLSAHATVGLPLSWHTALDGSGMVMPTSWGSGQIKLSHTWSLYNEGFEWMLAGVAGVVATGDAGPANCRGDAVLFHVYSSECHTAKPHVKT